MAPKTNYRVQPKNSDSITARCIMHSAVLLSQICLSVRLSVRDTEVLWSYKLGYFESNYTCNPIQSNPIQ